MKRQRNAPLRARSVRWSLVTVTRGLTPVWVSAKAYDRAAKRLLKLARDRSHKAMLKSRAAPLRLDLKRVRASAAAAGAQDNCSYVVVPELLGEVKGLTQVWVPTKLYDAVAAGLVRDAEDSYAKRLLRQRMAPLGVDYECQGSCYGGWCKEVELQPDELSALYVCECSYFV